jgi:hypothetical protein
MARKFLVVLVALLWLSAFSIDQAGAQWGQSNRSGNRGGGLFSPPQPPSHQPDIASGIIGIIGQGIEAAIDNGNQHNHGNHNHWPNQYPYYQRPNTVYVQPQVVRPQTIVKPKTEVKSNAPPIAKPEPKKEQKVALAPNSFSLNGAGITAADAHNTQEDAKDHIDDTVDDIRDDMTDKLEDDAESLEGVDKETQRKIKDRLKKGESVDDLIPDGAKPSDAADRLRKADDAFDELDEIADDAKKGRLRPRDLDNFEKDFGDLVDSTDDLTDDLDVIGEDSFWIDLMDHANPGGGLPPGMGTQIIYVPNMPAGQIVSLGNGTVLVGTGGATNGVVIMTGNAAQVAGLSVGIGQPVPDTDAELMLSGVLLVNLGEQTVNYNVNSDQFSMTPDYRQVLPGGQTWEVEFDRGGEHGKTKYGIADGTYGFTPTDDGWELFEQPESKVTIDNTSNEFPFNYILNNTQQTVAAGQANEHSSPYPLVIRFDNGAGQERRKLLDQEKYSLALTDSGTIDLFEPQYIEPPIAMEQVTKASAMSGRSLLEFDARRGGGLFSGKAKSSAGKGGLLSFH